MTLLESLMKYCVDRKTHNHAGVPYSFDDQLQLLV